MTHCIIKQNRAKTSILHLGPLVSMVEPVVSMVDFQSEQKHKLCNDPMNIST